MEKCCLLFTGGCTWICERPMLQQDSTQDCHLVSERTRLPTQVCANCLFTGKHFPGLFTKHMHYSHFVLITGKKFFRLVSKIQLFERRKACKIQLLFITIWESKFIQNPAFSEWSPTLCCSSCSCVSEVGTAVPISKDWQFYVFVCFIA